MHALQSTGTILDLRFAEISVPLVDPLKFGFLDRNFDFFVHLPDEFSSVVAPHSEDTDVGGVSGREKNFLFP